MPSDQEAMTIDQPPAATAASVGATLKNARLGIGKKLPEVATQLRIRQPFLEALEDGRHKDLPGGTYAVGFLRTYAEFLNLDGEEMVRRFRQEAAGELNSRAELVFPSPVSEGRIPGGAVLFVGLVIAGIAYGAWYWLSSKDNSVADMVPAIPERLVGVLHRGDSPPAEVAKPAEAPVEVKTDDVKPEETAPAEVKVDDAKAEGGKSVAEVVPPTEDEPGKAEKPAEPAKAEKPAEPAKAEKPAEPAKTDKPAEPAKAEVKVIDVPTKSEKVVGIDTPKPTEAADVAKVMDPAAEGKVIGADNAGSRIILRAGSDDCWVQVREMDGQLLLSRLLRKGDSYMVPNRPGLTLMVGNAGAIDIIVDGNKVPSVGAPGQVRRDIKLDADKLAGG